MLQMFRMDGMWILSEVEVIPDQPFGDPDVVLKYPYEYSGNEQLKLFPPRSAQRAEIPIRNSDVCITVNVDDKLAAKYYEKRSEENQKTT